MKDCRQEFCSKSCSATFNNKKRILSEETKKKQSLRLKEYWDKHPEKKKQNNIHSQKGKHKEPTSLLELSKRTISKICRRLKIGCSNCEWKEEICDIHHILARKDGGTDEHTNLTYLCPNCHRLAGKGKLTKFINLQEFLGDKWKEFYYG